MTMTAISNGAIIFDYGEDGDPDLFIGRFDSESVFLENAHNKNDFIALRLFGVEANHSAIGARVDLYPANQNASERSLLGTRIIESTSGYGSHSEKRIHFGVDSLLSYDAEIFFPGGDRVVLRDLQAGKYYDVHEKSAWPAFVNRIKMQVAIFFLGHRNTFRLLQSLLLLFLTATILFFKKQPFWWDPAARNALLVSFYAGFLSAHAFFVYQNDILYSVLPLLAGAITTTITISILKWWRLRNIPGAGFGLLSLKLDSFSHSENYANVLARLELYLNNFKQDAVVEKEIVDRFTTAVSVVQGQMHRDIETVISYTRTLQFQVDRVFVLHRTWRRFIRLLKKLRTHLRRQLAPEPAVVDRLKSVLPEIKTHLCGLREAVAQRETVNMKKLVEHIVNDGNVHDLSFIVEIPDSLPPAHIPAQELRTVLDELVANAQHAMRKRPKKEIRFTACFDRSLFLEISDAGHGIPPEQWQRIFQKGYSSKTNGGVGLFLVKQILERYGGSISVKASSQSGTTLLLVLQKAM